MKRILLIIGVSVGIICLLLIHTTEAQSQNSKGMKINADIAIYEAPAK